jgi:hypothetical protein
VVSFITLLLYPRENTIPTPSNYKSTRKKKFQAAPISININNKLKFLTLAAGYS